MKILEQTASRLKIQHRPLSQWLLGSCVALAGVCGLVYFVAIKPASAQLSCRHGSSVATATVCDLQQFNALGFLSSRKIYDLQGAAVIRQSSGRRGSTYHVSLQNGAESIALLYNADGGRYQQEAVVDQIHQFLYNSDQPPLTVRQNAHFTISYSSLFSLVGLGVGLWLTATPTVTGTLYKRLNKLVLEQKRWCDRGKSVEYPLNKILNVEVQEKRTKNGKVYRPVIILYSGERVPLSRDYIKEKPVREIAFAIETFIHQHFEK